MTALIATATTTASRTFHGSRKYDPRCRITPMSIIFTQIITKRLHEKARKHTDPHNLNCVSNTERDSL